jgi:phosphoribosyl 1,2-cyclic phosphodiesterase
MEDAIKFASLSEVKRLLLSHHDPFHSDSQLNEIFSEVQKKLSSSLHYELAIEGVEIELQ